MKNQHSAQSNSWPRGTLFLVAYLLFFLVLLLAGKRMQAQCSCSAPWPPPQNQTISVITPQQGAPAIQAAINNATGPTTIYLTNGTYSVANGQLNVIKPDITLRSQSGNRDSVILLGGGMLGGSGYHGISILKSNVTIADLTIKNIDTHPIDINFWYQPNADIDNITLRNLHIIDGGQQLVKMSYSGNPVVKSDNGVIECCLIEYTTSLPGNNYYTNGIDLHNAHGWIIRDNIIRNIKKGPTASNPAGPAILFFKGGSNATIERNTVVNCDEGIFLGNWGDNPNVSHSGGIIRNNFIRGHSTSRCGIGVVLCPNAIVINNSIYAPGGTAWTVEEYSIEVTGVQTTNLLIQNNLMDEDIINVSNSAPPFTTVTNLPNCGSGHFVNTSLTAPDLHLQSSSSGINAGTAHPQRTTDFDCESLTGAPDLGADELMTTGENEEEPVLVIRAWPNPVTQYLMVDFSVSADCMILDMHGNVMVRFRTEKHQILDLSALPAGMYLLCAEHLPRSGMLFIKE
ncbi:MAG: right-handed parallel beta-helix repeat-containing protein [Bacteroidia bacterium]|nr:right-handed parallel beta-helix repeat-containing protein [Bacteroidia bacterium]